jgi:phage terminase large subunit GpA-like protein
VNEFLASVDAVVTKAMRVWKPPPKLALADWADTYFYLSAESAAEPGRWHSLPYQRGIMNAITDPTVEQVSVMKSARVGYTKCMNATVGYFMHQDPCSILVVQPTVEDAKGYSKEDDRADVARRAGALEHHFRRRGSRARRLWEHDQLAKRFPGGVLSMIGANSGAGFRRVSAEAWSSSTRSTRIRRAPASDGDPIKLGTKRARVLLEPEDHRRLDAAVAGASRIERLFEAGDQRRFYVPCPQCDMATAGVRAGTAGTHAVARGPAREAFFVCSKERLRDRASRKARMVERGEWRAAAPFNGSRVVPHLGGVFVLAERGMGQLAKEFVAAKDNPETLKRFVNTVLGETWRETRRGADWERLYQRRETYGVGTVPPGVLALTAGVDVQKDRWVYEVVGWGDGEKSRGQSTPA